MCVRNVDDQGVLQFTLILAAGCVLHRRTSRVIHRQELCHNSWKSCVFHPVPNTKKTWVRKKKEERRPSLLHAGGKFPLPPHSTGPSLQALRRDTLHGRRTSAALPCVVGVISTALAGPGGSSGARHLWHQRSHPGQARPDGSPQAHVSLRARCLLCRTRLAPGQAWRVVGLLLGNDPSAGSPTETLLRLLLPLNDQV